MTNQLPANTIISVILITENHQSLISRYLKKLCQLLEKYGSYEIIVVDNNSSDGTVQKIKEIQKQFSKVRLLVLSKKHEKEMALTAGFDNCIGDFIFGLNVLTDSARLIDEVLPKLISGQNLVFLRAKNYDFIPSTSAAKFLTRILLKVYSRGLFSDVSYSVALTRKAVNALTKIRRKKRYYEYISASIGFNLVIHYYQPAKANLKYLKRENVWGILKRVIDASISHSVRPLRFVSFLGIIASFLNLLFLLYVFIVSLIKSSIAEGWITTSVIMGSMFLLLFMILTVISEYLLRILEETRQEPLYFIADEIDSSIFESQREQLNIV